MQPNETTITAELDAKIKSWHKVPESDSYEGEYSHHIDHFDYYDGPQLVVIEKTHDVTIKVNHDEGHPNLDYWTTNVDAHGPGDAFQDEIVELCECDRREFQVQRGYTVRITGTRDAWINQVEVWCSEQPDTPEEAVERFINWNMDTVTGSIETDIPVDLYADYLLDDDDSDEKAVTDDIQPDVFETGQKWVSGSETVKIRDITHNGTTVWVDGENGRRPKQARLLARELTDGGFHREISDGGMPPEESDFRHGTPVTDGGKDVPRIVVNDPASQDEATLPFTACDASAKDRWVVVLSDGRRFEDMRHFRVYWDDSAGVGFESGEHESFHVDDIERIEWFGPNDDSDSEVVVSEVRCKMLDIVTHSAFFTDKAKAEAYARKMNDSTSDGMEYYVTPSSIESVADRKLHMPAIPKAVRNAANAVLSGDFDETDIEVLMRENTEKNDGKAMTDGGTDMAITKTEYDEEIESSAEIIIDEYDLDETPVSDAVWETVDSHQWIIYTRYHIPVLEHSDSEPEEIEAYLADERLTWSKISQIAAYLVMEQDVTNAVYDRLNDGKKAMTDGGTDIDQERFSYLRQKVAVFDDDALDEWIYSQGYDPETPNEVIDCLESEVLEQVSQTLTYAAEQGRNRINQLAVEIEDLPEDLAERAIQSEIDYLDSSMSWENPEQYEDSLYCQQLMADYRDTSEERKELWAELLKFAEYEVSVTLELSDGETKEYIRDINRQRNSEAHNDILRWAKRQEENIDSVSVNTRVNKLYQPLIDPLDDLEAFVYREIDY